MDIFDYDFDHNNLDWESDNDAPTKGTSSAPTSPILASAKPTGDNDELQQWKPISIDITDFSDESKQAISQICFDRLLDIVNSFVRIGFITISDNIRCNELSDIVAKYYISMYAIYNTT